MSQNDYTSNRVILNMAKSGTRAKDKLSFVRLVRETEGALQKGYKPQEVVDAVVRAINPGMILR